jgi:hypothetical protein
MEKDKKRAGSATVLRGGMLGGMQGDNLIPLPETFRNRPKIGMRNPHPIKNGQLILQRIRRVHTRKLQLR